MRAMKPDYTHEATEGLPCDLPLYDEKPSLLKRVLGGPRGPLVLAVVAGLLVIAVAVLVVLNLNVGNERRGAVALAASQGVSSFAASAELVAQDVQGRALRGEGPVTGVVCIDAGHGGGADLTLTPIGPGSDAMQYVEPGGTSGVASGRDEAQVTLEVAQLLAAKLRDAGVTVVMVREDDSRAYSSEERASVANAAGADLFVRLHCDGSDDPGARGFSTLVPGYNEWTAAAGIVDSSALAASIMHPMIIAEVGMPDVGIIERNDLAGFNFCEVPSVLFEMGFMSNYEEDLQLNDPVYQERLAQAICDATIAYLEAVSG